MCKYDTSAMSTNPPSLIAHGVFLFIWFLFGAVCQYVCTDAIQAIVKTTHSMTLTLPAAAAAVAAVTALARVPKRANSRYVSRMPAAVEGR